jgi:acid phosphatase type 7
MFLSLFPNKHSAGVYFDVFTLPKNGEGNAPLRGVASGTEAYFSIDIGPVHIITLETMMMHSNETMMDWLLADAQAARGNGAKWLVTMFHHPPYSHGNHDSDFQQDMTNVRTKIVPLLEAAGVDLVLSGHSHSYERSYFIRGHYG